MGPAILIVGAVLSTVALLEGPAAAAEFPELSCALLTATEMFKVPVPEQFEIVTVRVAVPEPETAFVQDAVAVPPKEISASAKVTLSAFVYVTVQTKFVVLFPVVGVGPEIANVGAVLSTVAFVVGPAARA